MLYHTEKKDSHSAQWTKVYWMICLLEEVNVQSFLVNFIIIHTRMYTYTHDIYIYVGTLFLDKWFQSFYLSHDLFVHVYFDATMSSTAQYVGNV